jgi:hypothetical protein
MNFFAHGAVLSMDPTAIQLVALNAAIDTLA